MKKAGKTEQIQCSQSTVLSKWNDSKSIEIAGNYRDHLQKAPPAGLGLSSPCSSAFLGSPYNLLSSTEAVLVQVGICREHFKRNDR